MPGYNRYVRPCDSRYTSPRSWNDYQYLADLGVRKPTPIDDFPLDDAGRPEDEFESPAFVRQQNIDFARGSVFRYLMSEETDEQPTGDSEFVEDEPAEAD